MIQGGLKPTRHDHRDYDFFKSKKLGATLPAFDQHYNVDAGLWTPDQRNPNTLFNPNVPPMPYGCTNYTQNDLCVDEDKRLYNPAYTESLTHANEKGGTDLRTSLQAIVDHGVEDQAGNIHKEHPQYFRIKPSGIIDWFDAMRLAVISTSAEHRGVSVGSPWFPEFMYADANGIVGVPSFDMKQATWHNWAIKGWTTINGQPYLIGKPWLGGTYGDKGFCYFSRPIFNSLMEIPGTIAYTIDKLMDGEPEPVDSTVVQWIVSLIRNLMHL